MDNWKNDIKQTLKNMMPYAFLVNGNRVPMNQEAFDEAIGYVNEQVFLLMKRAYKTGFIKNAITIGFLNKEAKETVDFLADRAFEDWLNPRSAPISGRTPDMTEGEEIAFYDEQQKIFDEIARKKL